MALRLAIENETSLPDGGPLSVTVSGQRGLDIGRDRHLDWTLPDPSRFISGKHCEIRYRDGGYWLHDVSTNGTFLNGAETRMKGPHRLRNGDRLAIGHYIIAVTIDGEEAEEAPPPAAPAPAYHELWKAPNDSESAPPIDPAQLRPARESVPARPDFLDWAVDIPEARSPAPMPEPWPAPAGLPQSPPPAPAEPPPAGAVFDWAHGGERPKPEVAPAPPVPTPRRPVVWTTGETGGPWQAPTTARRPEPAAGALAAPPAAASPAEAEEAAAFLRRLAQAAGVPEQVFMQQAPEQLAEQIGILLRLVVENLRQLLQARLQAKRLARSTQQTTVEALDNNPLKFAPSAEEALRIMFGPPTRSYLDARRALEHSFADLKTHQLKTFAAMQQALQMLMADLDPRAIEEEVEVDRGIAALLGSRKAQLWEAYQARWQAMTARSEGGLIDAFMRYFAECYDRAGEERR